MQHTVLILGGSGRFGRHATQAFGQAGWNVRQFNRATDDLWDAAWGADVVVSTWNMPPGRWARDAVRAHQKVAEVAQASGATVLLPGNVYNYGSKMPDLLGPATPQRADTVYGRVRVDIEKTYRNAGAKTIVLRAGDFLDHQPSGNWFDRVIAAKLSKNILVYPGPLDRPHAWAFLPDLANAAVGLAAMWDELPQFADIPYAGLTMTGTEMAATLSQITGRDIQAKPMGWMPLRLLSPFWDVARYANDMRYLWEVPHRLDPTILAQYLPDHSDSDPRSALAAAIDPQLNPNGVVAGRADAAA